MGHTPSQEPTTDGSRVRVLGPLRGRLGLTCSVCLLSSRETTRSRALLRLNNRLRWKRKSRQRGRDNKNTAKIGSKRGPLDRGGRTRTPALGWKAIPLGKASLSENKANLSGDWLEMVFGAITPLSLLAPFSYELLTTGEPILVRGLHPLWRSCIACSCWGRNKKKPVGGRTGKENPPKK